MINPLKLGIIGVSTGNGHPYSWAAIFNGYNENYMHDCPYPMIYDYLKRQVFPDDTIKEANVTHIWTNDRQQSEQIARASNIPNVVNELEEMIGSVDAVLLARDDWENHITYASLFLKAGLPIYIDKPLATTLKGAHELLLLQQYNWQIFSCSALRYAKEFKLSGTDLSELGEVKFIEATVPKSWDKYAVHVIEPICCILNINDLEIIDQQIDKCEDVTRLNVTLNNGIVLCVTSFGSMTSDISIIIRGTMGIKNLVFEDSFFAFRESLKAFITGINQKRLIIPRNQTLSIVKLIELGHYEERI